MKKHSHHRTGEVRSKEKALADTQNYRQRTENKDRVRARSVSWNLLRRKKIFRPENCEICGRLPPRLKDGRSGLRADHYKGYERKNWAVVRFICKDCDGKQLRAKGGIPK